MKTFNPAVDTKTRNQDFIICYIDNPNLNAYEKALVNNDFDFHNGLSWYSHYLKTYYTNTKQQAIEQAKSLGIARVLCVTEGLVHLNNYIQKIRHDQYMEWSNWSAKFIEWINLDTANTQEVPESVTKVHNMYQHNKPISDLYYDIITNHKKWYVTNTETKRLWVEDNPKDEVIITGGALSFAIAAHTYFHKPSVIVVMDNVSIAHHMVQYIHENWNGENYYGFIKDVFEKNPQLCIDFAAFEEQQLKNYSEFLDDKKFKFKWREVTKWCKIMHVQQDLLYSDRILDYFRESNTFKKYIDFSNAFNYYPSACVMPRKNRLERYLQVEAIIRTKQAENKNFSWLYNERGMNGILRYK